MPSILILAIFFIILLVHAWGNQLVSELLLEPSDTLHAQLRHIEPMKKFDAIKILFDKMTAFWTYTFFLYFAS